MISIHEAQTKLLSLSFDIDTVFVKLDQSLGRVLGEDISAPFALPRFDHSAVDGYALCLKGTDSNFDLITQIQAGQSSDLELKPGQAARIFTGAPIPKGTDAVVMQENVLTEAMQIQVQKLPTLGQNIRRTGEEFRQGQVILKKSTRINPAVVGLLATMGLPEIPVFRKVRVALLITGDELKAAGDDIKDGQIFDSNGPSLKSALESLGAEVHSIGPISDQKESMLLALSQLESYDLLLSAGGVSVGDFDWVRPCVLESGFSEIFWKVAQKPGKPLFVAQRAKQIFMGLPGNPVAALVMVQLYVRPLLQKIHGMDTQLFDLPKLPLAESCKHSPGRPEWARAKIQGYGNEQSICLLKGQGSHMLGALALADALMLLDGEKSSFDTGEMVSFLPISWSL